MTKVSVCLAVYKTKPEYLKECLDSIFEQTYEDFELLIVDDCPEDKECEKIIKSYKDGRIKYYRNEKNLGISGTRNRLLNLARGEYVAVMDHDDISLPMRLEKEVAYLDAHPECGVVSCWYEKFPLGKIKEKPESNVEIIKALKNSCPLLHPAAMIRKAVLKDNNIQYEKEFTPAEDYALWSRLVGKTSFHNIQEVLFRYRDHETNESKQAKEKMKTATKLIRENILQPNIYALKHPLLEDKKISIIIPVYNVEKFLARCLDSVLAQTYQNFEVICINDGSTDNSPKILEEYKKRDARIKIFSQNNQGVSVARNNGIKKALGDYICFIDSDDRIESKFLSDLYEAIKTTDVDIVATNIKYIKGKKERREKNKQKIYSSFADKIENLEHGSCWNKIYKTEFIRKNQLTFPQGVYWEDNLFTIKAYFYSSKILTINGACYCYISNPHSITRNKEKISKQQQDSILVSRMIMDFAAKQQLTVKDKNALVAFCLRSFINAKFLLSDSYYQELMQIFSDNPSLKKTRRKQLFKHFLKNIFRFQKAK